MAYDRYDTRRDRDRGFSDYERGRRDERGFFERAGDEIASWFGDDEAERRRRLDQRMDRDFDRDRGWGREAGWNRDRDFDRDRDRGWRGERAWNRDRDFDRDRYAYRYGRPTSLTSGDRDYRPTYSGYERDLSPPGYGLGNLDRSYGSRGYGAGVGYGSGGYGPEDRDRHYHAWRERQLDELDRDYDEYRRERQERFENDFGTWRQNRQQKRGLLTGIREHMDVVGSDGETIGKVDCVKGDHVILTRSDSDDNRHHSIKCSMIDSVEGDQVRLGIPAEEARSRLRDEEDRGFFGRRDDEEMESTNLERSFSGTYR